MAILKYLKGLFNKPKQQMVFEEYIESPIYETFGFKSGFYCVKDKPNIFLFMTIHREILIRQKHIIVYDIAQDCILKQYNVVLFGWIDPDLSEIEKECKIYEDVVEVQDYYENTRLHSFIRKICDINIDFASDIKYLLLCKFKKKLLNSKGYLKFKNTYIKYIKNEDGDYTIKLLDAVSKKYVEFNYTSDFEFLFENFYALDLCDCPIGDIDD
jgi:hypothetical protein